VKRTESSEREEISVIRTVHTGEMDGNRMTSRFFLSCVPPRFCSKLKPIKAWLALRSGRLAVRRRQELGVGEAVSAWCAGECGGR
jgi:hypothetical protein